MSQHHYFTRDVPMGEIQGPGAIPTSGGRVYAKFSTRTMKDEALSASRGRFVPREVEMVTIIIPGDSLSVVERRARDADKQRFPKEYEAFKKMQEFVPDGTPLETWPLLSRAQVEDLRYNGIHTVEDLADIADSNLPALGLGGRTLRKHAQAFIETSKAGALPAQLVRENEDLKTRLEMLTNQLETLSRRFESDLAKKGVDVAEQESPAAEARKAISELSTRPKAVDIPDDYKNMNLRALKALVQNFTEAPVVTKQDAFELISEYKASIGD